MIARLCLVSVFLTLSSSAKGEVYNVTIPPRSGDAYQMAHYRLWLPEKIKTVRAIIFRQHGCGPGARKLGREHANDLQWQALATKWDCALMGSQLWAPKEDCSTWTMPADGSAHAFLTALKKLAKLSNHPELEQVPWALWGHSGGAIWVTNMTYHYPQRILATFPRSGGLSPLGREYKRSQPASPDSNPEALKVPILFCYGSKEYQKKSRFYKLIQGVYQVYDHGRSKGAVWAIAEHPGSDHENSYSRLLAIRYFDAILAKSLPKAGQGKPLRLDPSTGWLGDPKRQKIYPAGTYKADQGKLAWLPDEATAKAWLEFIRTGAIRDTTPPPSPTGVVARQAENGILLTWKALADVESGIAEFRVFRNGKQIGTVKGTNVPRWNPKAHFHAWNYSDQPQPQKPEPKMQFLDRSKQDSTTANYRIVTVNQAGLASQKSRK